MTPSELRFVVVSVLVVLSVCAAAVIVYDRIDQRRTKRWIEKRLGRK